MLAMQRLEPVDAGILALLADDQHTIEDVVLPRLGRMMRSRHRPFVLVLDDVDAVTSPACLSIVSALAKHLPDGSQLVLLGRASPALDWNDMLAKRRVVEIGMNQLRLSPAEAEALVEATGLELSRPDVQELVDRTEGWAAGLYLAAIVLQESDCNYTKITRPPGSPR